ncbi:1-phosphofructokinase family hexose kinase [Flaviaesturariibacter amylovorans]|uniref:1-phosphofructokinase family hexose kinase n=1 Tax=Flaviaesturariibacter amylovorans TaxID=1084520 RepID=A0ABP8G7C9_9BACT
MIVTLTFNPAVDKTTTADRLIPEKKLRCSPPTLEAGGGGINISKALHELGAESTALFPAGGPNGQVLERLLRDRGIRHVAVPVSGDTRESFTVNEAATNGQYRFILPGGALSEAEIEALFAALAALAPQPTWVIASGSLPPGAPEDLFGRLSAHCRRLGARFIVDTSGAPLQRALEEGVFLLKPNLSELSALAGREYVELQDVEAAAREVIGSGRCPVLIVSMGPAGALAISKEATYRVPAPVVRKQSTVGAGDSMIAGITYMLQRGEPLLTAVRFGVACGTAATMNPGSQLFKKDDAWRLYEWIAAQGS